jgi:hypothetical protein
MCHENTFIFKIPCGTGISPKSYEKATIYVLYVACALAITCCTLDRHRQQNMSCHTLNAIRCREGNNVPRTCVRTLYERKCTGQTFRGAKSL